MLSLQRRLDRLEQHFENANVGDTHVKRVSRHVWQALLRQQHPLAIEVFGALYTRQVELENQRKSPALRKELAQIRKNIRELTSTLPPREVVAACTVGALLGHWFETNGLKTLRDYLNAEDQ
jgi:hypothetical protein